MAQFPHLQYFGLSQSQKVNVQEMLKNYKISQKCRTQSADSTEVC